MRAVNAKEAKQINERLGLSTCENDGVRTFWAYDDEHEEIYDFDSKRERDDYVRYINMIRSGEINR